jgi:hypothetical protein
MASDPYAELRYILHGRRRPVRDLEPRPFKRRGAPSLAPPSPSPCPGCRHLARCEAERLACQARAIFENQDRYSAVAPRQPTREAWDALYGDDA